MKILVSAAEPGLPEYKYIIEHTLKVYEDIATFRGELKTLGRTIIREKYDIFPPSGSNMTAAESTAFTKAAIIRVYQGLPETCGFSEMGHAGTGTVWHSAHCSIRVCHGYG
jgi:hypothetical protein